MQQKRVLLLIMPAVRYTAVQDNTMQYFILRYIAQEAVEDRQRSRSEIPRVALYLCHLYHSYG